MEALPKLNNVELVVTLPEVISSGNSKIISWDKFIENGKSIESSKVLDPLSKIKDKHT